MSNYLTKVRGYRNLSRASAPLCPVIICVECKGMNQTSIKSEQNTTTPSLFLSLSENSPRLNLLLFVLTVTGLYWGEESVLSVCSFFRILKRNCMKLVFLCCGLTWNLFCCMPWCAVEFTTESKCQPLPPPPPPPPPCSVVHCLWLWEQPALVTQVTRLG